MLQVGPGFEFMGRPKEMENHKPYLSWGCWNSQRPSHCWTFQLHALGAPVRTSVCCENASAFWPVVDCVDQKASQCWSRSNSPDWLKGCCRNQRERCCSKVFHSILKPCWCEWKKIPPIWSLVVSTNQVSLKVGLIGLQIQSGLRRSTSLKGL